MSRTRRRGKSRSANHFVGQPVPACENGQCVRAVKMPTSTSSTLTLNPQTDASSTATEESTLANILPRDYFDAMLESAKYGFLYAFISSTPIEFFNQHFKACGMTANQIYYANQAIRATAYLGLSVYLGFLDLKSLMFAIGAPMSSVALKYHGCSDLVTTLAPAGAAFAVQIAADVNHYSKTILTIMSGLGGTLLGNSLAQKTYSWTSAGLFKVRNIIAEAIANEPESTFRQPI